MVFIRIPSENIMDRRIRELADLLVNYSCTLQKGEKVLISYEGECCKPLIRQIIKEVYKVGAFPYVEIRDSQITREILLGCEEEQLKFKDEIDLAQMKGMDAYIAVRAGANTSELSDVPSEKMKANRPLLAVATSVNL